MEKPQTHYTSIGDISIAYQVIGDGPIDLLYAQGWLTNIEYAWECPEYAEFLTKLGRFSRLIFFDKRGTGLSERDVGTPTLEQRTEDLTAVLDAVGSERAALFGVSEGGNMAALFAAIHPDRTQALVLSGCLAKGSWALDYPWRNTLEQIEDFIGYMQENWGKPFDLKEAAPGRANDAAAKAWWGAYIRSAASPKTAARITRLNAKIDIRGILPTISCPTLVVNRDHDAWGHADEARYLAETIPNARLKLLPGDDHFPWFGDQDRLVEEIEEFLTGQRSSSPSERVLVTVLLTDIVGSTDRAAALGDLAWRRLLDQHDAITAERVHIYGGRTVNSTGDGMIAAFTGPSRAIECAAAIAAALAPLDLEIRAGIHTGECERRGEDLGGLAVHITARIQERAPPGQILVSGTVKDLTVGSGLTMTPFATETLKGVPGDWPLYLASA